MEIKTEIKKIKMYKAVGFLASVSCVALLGLNLQQSASVRQMTVDGTNRDKAIAEIAKTNAQLVQSVKVLTEDNKSLTDAMTYQKKLHSSFLMQRSITVLAMRADSYSVRSVWQMMAN